VFLYYGLRARAAMLPRHFAIAPAPAGAAAAAAGVAVNGTREASSVHTGSSHTYQVSELDGNNNNNIGGSPFPPPHSPNDGRSKSPLHNNNNNNNNNNNGQQTSRQLGAASRYLYTSHGPTATANANVNGDGATPVASTSPQGNAKQTFQQHQQFMQTIHQQQTASPAQTLHTNAMAQTPTLTATTIVPPPLTAAVTTTQMIHHHHQRSIHTRQRQHNVARRTTVLAIGGSLLSILQVIIIHLSIHRNWQVLHM
jgi:hypothetical protein